MDKVKAQKSLQQASAFIHQGRIHDAATLISAVVKAYPKHINARHMLGSVATLLGQYDTADRILSRVIRERPEAGMYQNLARNTQVQGDLKRARLLYRKALELDPQLYMAYYNLAQITKFNEADSQYINAVLSSLKNTELEKMDRSFLNFAAGKYFDDLKSYQKAFVYTMRGNVSRDVKFDKATYVKSLKLQLSKQYSEYYRAPNTCGVDSQQPVFIVGMPRSGTTLLEQALSCHSRVHGAGELPDFPAFAQQIERNEKGGNTFPEGILETTDIALAEFANSYLKMIQSLGGENTRVIDKNPVNHQHIGLIIKIFPNAKFIHCSRDAMDICISCFFQNFRIGQDFSFSFSGLATYYQGYLKYIEHWKNLFPDNIIDIRYEDTVRDLESNLKKVLNFLDLSWEEQCMDFHNSDRPVSTASVIQVRQPLYQGSISKFERYGDCFKVLKSMLETEQFS